MFKGANITLNSAVIKTDIYLVHITYKSRCTKIRAQQYIQLNPEANEIQQLSIRQYLTDMLPGHNPLIYRCVFKSKKESKAQGSIQSSTTPDLRNHMGK